MTLREKQSLFARLLGELLVWIYAQGFEVTLAEGAVTEKRRVRTAAGPAVVMDMEHMSGSLHYARLAQDLNLFVGGQIVVDGNSPEWRAIGAHWKSLNPECAWGGDFKSVDSNHVSLRHGGRS